MLADSGAQLSLIEIDRDLACRLEQRFQQHPNVDVYCADILLFPLEKAHRTTGKLKVVANLPYNISTAVLFQLAAKAELIGDAVLMLQLEVVDRLLANPGSKQYGRLSVMSQWTFTGQRLLEVPAAAFYPPPRVNSAVVRLIPHHCPPAECGSPEMLAALVRLLFSQRRKTLRNGLKPWLSLQDFAMLNIDPQQRPDHLTVIQFAQLSSWLHQHHPNSASQL